MEAGSGTNGDLLMHGDRLAHDSLLGMALLVVKLGLQAEDLLLKLGKLMGRTRLLLPLSLEMVQLEAMTLPVELDIVPLRHREREL